MVFLTGDRQAKPKLGIDLQGGTRVTLTARTPDGSAPTREALTRPSRSSPTVSNGLGVSGSEVVIDGDNLVITVPGNDGSEARNLGQTARLYIRPVIHVMPARPAAPQAGQPPAEAPPTGPPPGERRRRKPPPAAPPAGDPPPSRTATGPGAGAAAPPVSAGAAAHPGPATHAPARRRPHRPHATPKSPPTWRSASPTRSNCGRAPIRRSSCSPCSSRPPAAARTTCWPATTIRTCRWSPVPPTTTQVYLLDKSIISGEQIENATSGLDQQRGEYVVDLQFKGDAANVWADFTAANVGTQTAFTLDSQVVSAPQIQEAIPGGRTQITGQFTADSARELANVLKYGSLPLSFESSEAQTVSATLGLTSLRAGLIAGALGLALVLIYSLLYYRALGLLVALSLIASGAMIFAILVLLGRYIGYTLDLAGIAGLIIGIGTTADSFVVFFERIKDEIREGRSFRSAVPRGWARARETILSGNAVTLLAAVVLYFMAVGQVKGFAFTLGLTTILDTVVVFLVTWPLVYLASKSTTMAKPVFNGLGAVQQIARERRAAAQATGRG